MELSEKIDMWGLPILEQTPEYSITVGAIENPDLAVDNIEFDATDIPTKVLSASSIEAAVRMAKEFIKANNLGGGNWGPEHGVIKKNGKRVGRMSYNGKVSTLSEAVLSEGMFSWISSVSKANILYGDEVVVVLPNDEILSGTYDGYGRVGGVDIFAAVHKAMKNPKSKFMASEKAFDDFMEKSDALRSKAFDNYDGVEANVKIMHQNEYKNQKFSQLKAADRDPSQGFDSNSARKKMKISRKRLYGS